ncbi:MAG: YkvA family protein [Candidatus Kapabacteria bacterium]|nr:YkvA family protein [Candidatus Kapabacteria bacterium]
MIERIKHKVKHLKSEVIALYFAYSDPRVPWYAKLFIVILVGYALSPIDLIPDFIPILGYLDDLILIPLGITVALKMIPNQVMVESRIKASTLKTKPRNWIAVAVIVVIWLIIIGLVVNLIFL